MEDQLGVPALRRRFMAEAPFLASALPELPRLLHQKLVHPPLASDPAIAEVVAGLRARTRWLGVIALLLAAVLALLVLRPL
jgi:hypothetical protein